MILFIKLIIAHLIGDFILQPSSWVKDKEEKKGLSLKLYYHIIIHIILMILLTREIELLVPILIIGIGHYIIDLSKLSSQTEQNKRMAFAIDQIAHLLLILIIANQYQPFLSDLIVTQNINQLYLIFLSLILLIPVSSKTIKILISKWTTEEVTSPTNSLDDAGNYIGILERLFVFCFVVTGNISAIGFLVAAKSVFRFGDLTNSKNRKLTEYVLIGTLISFGLAIAISYTYLQLSQLIE